MKTRIIPAIMSGGSGTRLWPASTDIKPKQFHALGGSDPLIVETLQRVQGETGAVAFAAPIIISNVRHASLVEAQLAQIGVHPQAVVLEPAGRDTAAVGAIAAEVARSIDPDALVLLLPADHVIADRAAFLAAIDRAAPVASDHIVTFGITPSRPETGYGYIKRGESLSPGVFSIESFHEKPEPPRAEMYYADKSYSWNAGMFLFSPAVLLREFGDNGDIRDGALAALAKARRDGARIMLDEETFAATRKQPLDKAVMEKTRHAAVVPCDIGWADIGSWDEMWRISEADDQGNVLHGAVLAVDAENNLLRSDGVTLVVKGVRDLIVVATRDAVLILPRGASQDVKELYELQKRAKPEA